MATAAEIRSIAFLVYWKLLVFGLPAVVVCSAVAGLLFGFGSSALGFRGFDQSVWAGGFYFLVGTVVNFLVFNHVLARVIGVQFGKIRLELIEAP